MTTDSVGPASALRFGVRALAFVLLAASAGGAIAGGVTAAAVAADPHAGGAFAERWKSSPEGKANMLVPATPGGGFAFGIWRGTRFGAAAGMSCLVLAGLPGLMRLRLRGALAALLIATIGAAITAAGAAGVGAVMGPHAVSERMGYVAGRFPRDVEASTAVMTAAVAREGLFWGGVGWSALAALWLRAAWRSEDGAA